MCRRSPVTGQGRLSSPEREALCPVCRRPVRPESPIAVTTGAKTRSPKCRDWVARGWQNGGVSNNTRQVPGWLASVTHGYTALFPHRRRGDSHLAMTTTKRYGIPLPPCYGAGRKSLVQASSHAGRSTPYGGCRSHACPRTARVPASESTHPRHELVPAAACHEAGAVQLLPRGCTTRPHGDGTAPQCISRHRDPLGFTNGQPFPIYKAQWHKAAIHMLKAVSL
jgi:hypothetical protein